MVCMNEEQWEVFRDSDRPLPDRAGSGPNACHSEHEWYVLKDGEY
jgi:hypothetical protein